MVGMDWIISVPAGEVRHQSDPLSTLEYNITLVGGADDDAIHGGNDPERIYGLSGSDEVRGGGGDDWIEGGGDDDSELWGEGGSDKIWVVGHDTIDRGHRRRSVATVKMTRSTAAMAKTLLKAVRVMTRSMQEIALT
jgi:Ca2+-binding RTX toxin-like protein